MSSITDTLARHRRSGPEAADPLRPPTGRRNRRSALLIGSLVLVFASIAGFAELYSSADHKVPAVVLVRSVTQGHVLTQSDLGVADVALSSGVGYVPVDQASQLAGKRTAAAIPSGSLLTLADVTTAPAIGPGDAVVGIALKQGSLPAAGLSPGDLVMVVQTAGPGAVIGTPPAAGTPAGTGGMITAQAAGGAVSSGGRGGASGVLIASASVFGVAVPNGTAGGGYSLIVSLEVPSSVASDVATAAGAGQVSLVLLPAIPLGTGSPPATGSASATAPVAP